MQEAIRRGNLATVQLLINAGVDVNGRNGFGSTPLSDAIISKQPVIANLLIDAGAKADLQGPNRLSPLYFALEWPQPDRKLILRLIKDGADVNRKAADAGDTPLIETLKNADEETAVLLIKNGADVNIRSENGESALTNAARLPDGALSIGTILLDRGATLPKTDCQLTIMMYTRQGGANIADRIAALPSCKSN